MNEAVNLKIAEAAQSVADARAALERATTAFAGASAKRNAIATRIQVLSNARGAIVSRRQEGDCAEDDGPKLALIAADLEGLAALLTDADVIVADLKGPVDMAQRAVVTAGEHIRLAEDTASEAALIEHAKHLDGLLLETIARLRVIHTRRGRGMPIWGPSKALAGEVRRLLAARMELF